MVICDKKTLSSVPEKAFVVASRREGIYFRVGDKTFFRAWDSNFAEARPVADLKLEKK